MAQGDVHLNDDGTVALDAAGKVRLQDGDDTCPDCCGCTGTGDPCVDCDWGTYLVDPQDAVTTGATDDDETWCETIPNASFFSYTETSDYCSWSWSGNNVNTGVLFTVIYAKVNGVQLGVNPGCTGTINTGEWGAVLFIESLADPTSTVEWEEKTTGFCCDASTNTINGEHEFSVGPCDGSACGGTPKVVVAVTP